MSSFSILNNAAAASALFNLNRTQTSLNAVQEHINTGLKIGSAKDNASTYAVSLGMKNDVAGYKSIRDTVALGKGTVQVAMDTADSVGELLEKLKDKVVQAQSENVDHAAIQDEIDQLRDQIDTIVGTAQFNGVNLVGDAESAAAGKKLKVLASLDRASASEAPTPRYIEVRHQNLTTANLGVNADDAASRAISTINVDRSVDSLAAGKAELTVDMQNTAGAAAAQSNTFEVVVQDEVTGQAYIFTLTADSNTPDVNTFDPGADDNATFANIVAKFAANSTIVGRAAVEVGGVWQADATKPTDTKIWSETGFAVDNLVTSLTATRALRFSDSVEGEGYGLVTTQTNIANANASSTTFVADEDSVLVGFDSSKMTVNTAMAGGEAISLTLYKSSGEKVTVTYTAAAADDEGEIAAGLLAQAQTDGLDLTAMGVSIGFSTADNTVTVQSTGIAGGVAIGGLSIATATVDGTLAAQSLVEIDNQRSFAASLAGEIDKVEQAVEQIKDASSLFGSIAARLDLQDQFLEGLMNNLNDGISSLIDANMAEESAKFQALQVQQQLGLQALSIANQAPQAVLSLFR